MLNILVLVSLKSYLSFSIHQKLIYTGQYLELASNQSLGQIVGVIHTLCHRVNIIIMKDEDNIIEEKHLKKVLISGGYPDWAYMENQPL